MNGETPQPSSESSVTVSGSNKGLWAGLGALLVLILLGVGGYFFFGRGPNPTDVVKKMWRATANATQWSGTTDFSFNFEGDNLPLKSMQFGASSTADTSKEGDEQFQTSLQLDFKFKNENTGAVVGIGANVEVRLKGDVVYARLASLDVPSELQPILNAYGLQSIQGQWLKVDAGALTKQLMSGLSSSQQGDLTKFEKALDTVKEQYLVLLEKHPILKVTKTFSNDRVGGVTTHHYEFVIDNEHYRAFTKELSEAFVRLGGSLAEQDAKEIDEAVARLKRESFPDIDKLDVKGKGEIWIGVNDAYLYKVTFTPEGVPVDDGMGGKATMSGKISGEMKSYGKPFSVEEPTQAIPLEQLVQQMLQSYLPQQ